ncbi:glycosyltransferase family protein [Desulfopila inferna]|uniref:glycosyltransferase family protein n=1 Tax=Desulfopila inferna TaxID=468528 RepID=UPI001966917D|nr:glycosyltransferase [Desulfopila inferna]MBM9605525.1 glycosyl transferase [Desulfopila inferna]
MRIAYYCQNVLGIGHFHRSLEICKQLARLHRVTMITGGASLPGSRSDIDISFFQLPGLMMDSRFNNLAPCDSSQTLNETKKLRAEMLYGFFQSYKPDVFLIELYPFGRKAFRFELDPVLESIKKGHLSPCLCFCSLRDILVERHDSTKFENRIIATLNSHFDGLLIHGDQNLISLDQTFSRVSDITVPIAYTGYVTPPVPDLDRVRLRKNLGIEKDTRLIVASIGGGNVGTELLFAVAESLRFIDDKSLSLHIFTGPYASQSVYDSLRNSSDKRIKVERFTPHFTDWLLAADLSVSMAGYNTTMNILSTGVPSLLYPFSHNSEQSLRIGKLQKMAPLTILKGDELSPDRLAALILGRLAEKRFNPPIRLDGAQITVTIVEQWYQAMREK